MKLWPNIIWQGNKEDKSIYLTFDDGPIPEATNAVLEILSLKGVKATFFCLGVNVSAHKDLVEHMALEGHQIGNHSRNHESGWKTAVSDYLSSIDACQRELEESKISSNYFRPPYGKLKYGQWKRIKQDYKIVMWTLMTGDFDQALNKDDCLNYLVDNIRQGDIVVFHDNEKSLEKVKYVLPRFLDHCLEKGFEFKLIDQC